MTVELIILIIVGYLAGSIPFGKLVGLAQGVDIQKRGSGNIGYANVARILGWKAGIVTLAGDVGKGFFPALIAASFLPENAVFWVGYAAIIGHVFPVWLRFRGGKGVATGLGMLLMISPLVAAMGALTYIVGRLTIGKSSDSSVAGILVMLIVGLPTDMAHWWYYIVLALTAGYTLRQNIIGTVPDYDI